MVAVYAATEKSGRAKEARTYPDMGATNRHAEKENDRKDDGQEKIAK